MGCLCVGLLLSSLPAAAAELGRETGYPVPRFVSIDRDEANLRSGPGRQYPILAVLQWRGMPVKIVDEYGRWRKVELHDAAGGWIHRVLLSGRRTFLVQAKSVALRTEPSDDAAVMARFQAGVIADLTRCLKDWCRVEYAGYDGWVPRAAGWGVLPGETIE